MNGKFADKINAQRDYETHADIRSTKPQGRPKKAEDKKQSQKVFVNLTIAEKEKLEKRAEEVGTTIANLLRMTLKEREMI